MFSSFQSLPIAYRVAYEQCTMAIEAEITDRSIKEPAVMDTLMAQFRIWLTQHKHDQHIRRLNEKGAANVKAKK